MFRAPTTLMLYASRNLSGVVLRIVLPVYAGQGGTRLRDEGEDAPCIIPALETRIVGSPS